MAARQVTKPKTSASPYAQIERRLGAESLCIENSMDLHERIEKGLPRRTMVRLIESLTVLNLAESFRALNVSPRTWHRIKAETRASARLDADQSARVWNLAEILTKAEEVLGSREDAEQWMANPAIGLSSRRPIDLLATPHGAEMVRTLLDQMAYGVYV